MRFSGYFWSAQYKKSFVVDDPESIINLSVTIFEIYDFFVILKGFYPVNNS